MLDQILTTTTHITAAASATFGAVTVGWYSDLASLSNHWAYVAFFGMLGAIVGSFSGVVIDRIPRNEGLGHRSSCDSCATSVPAWRNIPIVTWVLQKGRCHECSASIPMWVWGVELLSAVGWGVGSVLTEDPLAALAFGLTVSFSVVLGGIDWKTTFIYWGPYFGFGAAAWATTLIWAGMHGTWDAVAGGAAWGFGSAIVMAGINYLYKLVRGRDGLGGGDGLLSIVVVGVLGALSGTWWVPLYGLYAGFLIGAVWGVAATRGSDSGKQAEFALGPYLMAGPFLAWLALSIGGWL
ncbi:MAG: prepilin peptidase [Maioricimonas sp. JB049]